MSIPGSAEPFLLAQQDTGYKIERSLRFNSSDSAYLSRTPASAGNRKTWTWAGWVKRSNITSNQALFGTLGSSNDSTTLYLAFISDSLRFSGYSIPTSSYIYTSQVFRDTSAWLHLVLTLDTTQATAANRLKLYINGQQITSFSTDQRSLIAQNADLPINSTQAHDIGRVGSAGIYGDFYLADVFFIDGQALDPTSFTEVSATTGQLIPKAYTGSFGTNGFWLKFSDNSAATATTLGKDYSGNGNNWTPNNLSVTAGAGNDSLVDTPTSYGTDTGAGGEVRGNYCTLNPLQNPNGVTLSNGNLDMVTPNNAMASIYGTLAASSGKWYWEFTQTAYTVDGAPMIGIANVTGSAYWVYAWDGRKLNSSSQAAYGATFTNNDVIGIALDINSGTLTFYKNGVSQGAAYTGLAAETYLPVFKEGGTVDTYTANVNFGQRSFAYTAPSGFKALCDTNLPAPVVAKPSTVMDVALWTGTGSARSITGLSFSPDFTWIKQRSSTEPHVLSDSVRGSTKSLYSNTTGAEETEGPTAYNSDGFSLGTGWYVNRSGSTYVGWAWDAGTTTSSNTQGSITSQVRANASAGFSIVTYTGNATTGATVGHGLGVAPRLIIAKRRDGAVEWPVYHASAGAGYYLYLNTTAAAVANTVMWNNTTPSSSTFSIGNYSDINANTGTYVAYCFAPVAGYSSFGSYTGNGSSDGPFVFTGMRPRWILIKRTDATQNWPIIDTSRDTYNIMNRRLFANLSDAEDQGIPNFIDITANGFKCRDSNISYNASGGTYIYAAFAESPFAYSRAR